MKTSTHRKTDVYLPSSTTEALLGTKFPSIDDVLQVYLHYLKQKRTKHDAAQHTVKEVFTFWGQARILNRCIDNDIK